MTDYTFNLPVKPKQLEAIGMVACEWSYLESIIEAAIWKLSDFYDFDRAAAITAHLGMPTRLHMLETLFRLQHGDIDATRTLRKKCETIRNELSGQRGAIIHTRWVEGEYGSPMSYTVRARGKLVRTKKGLSHSEIRACAAAIADQAERLLAFLLDHDAVDFPLRHISD